VKCLAWQPKGTWHRYGRDTAQELSQAKLAFGLGDGNPFAIFTFMLAMERVNRTLAGAAYRFLTDVAENRVAFLRELD